MHLTPREHERLLLAAAADLARRRLARGAPLGATEAVALVCDEVCELAWDGVPLEEVIARARTVIPPAALLPGVAGLVPVIEVEALFPWGSTLVHVDAPFAEVQEQGEAERVRLTPDAPAPPASSPGGPAAAAGDPGRAGRLAAAASEAGREVPGQVQGQAAAERVRPAPDAARSPAGEPGGPAAAAGASDGDAGPGLPGVPYGPGAVLPRAGVIELAAGAARRAALLRNTGPRDVWISSHFPLGEVNPAVRLRWAGEEEPAPVPGPAPVGDGDASAGSGTAGADGGDTGAGSGTAGAGSRDTGAGSRDTGAGSGTAGANDGDAGAGGGTAGAGDGTAVSGGTRADPSPPWRLDLPAGEALLLRAGEERPVTVIVTPG